MTSRKGQQEAGDDPHLAGLLRVRGGKIMKIFHERRWFWRDLALFHD
jgi:hypothetical protein